MNPKQQHQIQSRIIGTKLVEAKIVQCQSCKLEWEYHGVSNHHCYCPNPRCHTKVTFFPSKPYPTTEQKLEQKKGYGGRPMTPHDPPGFETCNRIPSNHSSQDNPIHVSSAIKEARKL